MLAKPIRALQLHYPMIQFLIIVLIHVTRHLCTRFRTDGIKAMSSGISGGKQVMRFANRPFARWRHFTTAALGGSLGTIVMQIRDDIIGKGRRRSSAVGSRRSRKVIKYAKTSQVK